MTALLPPVLTAAQLPHAELQAARLDGELHAYGLGFSLADEPDTALQRARSVRAGVPPRLIADRRTAAWIWGARHCPPARIELCIATQARVSCDRLGWADLREVAFEPAELIELAGLPVTTPLRTAYDLLRGECFDAAEVDTVRRLASLGGFDDAECCARVLAGRNLPFRHRALGRLELVFGRSDLVSSS